MENPDSDISSNSVNWKKSPGAFSSNSKTASSEFPKSLLSSQPLPTSSSTKASSHTFQGDPECTLHIWCLSRNVKTEHLQEVFGVYGVVTKAHLALDKNVGIPKGYAYVEFDNFRDAQRAKQCLNGAILDGREIKVEFLSKSREKGKSNTLDSRSKNSNETINKRNENEVKRELFKKDNISNFDPCYRSRSSLRRYDVSPHRNNGNISVKRHLSNTCRSLSHSHLARSKSRSIHRRETRRIQNKRKKTDCRREKTTERQKISASGSRSKSSCSSRSTRRSSPSTRRSLSRSVSR